jgi:hypothetical protein
VATQANRHRQAPPFKANTVWACDFVFDTNSEGQQIKA